MEQDLIQLFGITKFILITSDTTNQPYIDKKGACYFLDSSSEAAQFTKLREHTKLSEAKFYKNIQSYVDTLYLKGIKTLKIKLADRDNFLTYEIKNEDLRKNRYSNPEANFYLARLRETNEQQYLEKLANCVFITPISLPYRNEGDYPEIKYCVLKREAKKYNIIFTTLQEYNKWSETQISQYFPLEVNFLKTNKIRKENGLFINPLSDKMLIEAKEVDKLNRRKS